MDRPTDLNLTHLVRPALERAQPGRQVPGLLLLHGRGADEEDLMALESALDPRFTIVSARAPYRLGPGWTWYGMPGIGRPDATTFLASLSELQHFVRALPAAYDLDPDRLLVFGFSQGAILASALAMSSPGSMRALVMHSGYVPQALNNVEIDLSPAGLAARPVFVAHGIYDDVLPVSFARRSRDYLEEAGADLYYKEYPIGHSISEESLYDVSEWLTRHLNSD